MSSDSPIFVTDSEENEIVDLVSSDDDWQELVKGAAETINKPSVKLKERNRTWPVESMPSANSGQEPSCSVQPATQTSDRASSHQVRGCAHQRQTGTDQLASFVASATPVNKYNHLSGSFLAAYGNMKDFFLPIQATNMKEFVSQCRTQLREVVANQETEYAISSNRALLKGSKPVDFGSYVFPSLDCSDKPCSQKCDLLMVSPSALESMPGTCNTPAPSNNAANKSLRGRGKRGKKIVSSGPVSYEGTATNVHIEECAISFVHPIPCYSAWIVLKNKFSCADDPLLRYVCYFGDNDYEDVMADVYEQDHVDTQGKNETKERIAELYEQDDAVIEQFLNKYSLDRFLTCTELDELEQALNRDDVPTRGGARGAKDKVEEDADESFMTRCSRLSKSLRRRLGLEPIDRALKSEASESLLMDSFRSLFCRICFVYDCQDHIGSYPGEEYEEAIWQAQKQWMRKQDESSHGVCGDSCYLHGNMTHLPEQSESTKRLMEKTLVVSSGSPCKAAALLRVPCNVVYAATRELLVGGDKSTPQQLQCNLDIGCTKYIQNEFSRKAFATQFVKSLANSETSKKLLQEKKQGLLAASSHTPCVHLGPCTSSNGCSCATSGSFCTKHCSCAVYNCEHEKNGICRNLFPGCRCLANCGTKQCPCFSTSSVCDADLCNCEGSCVNKKFDSVHLLLAESSVPGAGWGIFTRHSVPQGKMICDYLGEVVSQEEAERRGRYYDKVNRSYLFNVNADQVVDAFRKGNKIKFANHSKKPNCEVKIFTITRQQHILFYAKRDIEAGEELFFNYNYEQEQKSASMVKNGVVVDWMRDAKRANTVRKRPMDSQLVSGEKRRKDG